MIWSRAQSAIVRKDMREAMSTKLVKATMLITPIMLAVFMPAVMTAAIYYGAGAMNDFDTMIEMLPIQFNTNDMLRAAYYYMMNYLVPVFFILIPIMAASVSAGSSFVGEKERRTLTTLLFSPLTVRQLFSAKVMGAFALAMLVTAISFAGFLAVAIVGSILVYGDLVLDLAIWAIMLLLISPSISLIGVTAIVMASARATTFQEAQQYAAIILVPVMLLMMLPQVLGIFLYNAPQLALLGTAFLLIALILIRLTSARFTPEKLLG